MFNSITLNYNSFYKGIEFVEISLADNKNLIKINNIMIYNNKSFTVALASCNEQNCLSNIDVCIIIKKY